MNSAPWPIHEQAKHRAWTSHVQAMSFEQAMSNKQAIKESWTDHEQFMNKNKP